MTYVRKIPGGGEGIIVNKEREKNMIKVPYIHV
jgi:hypothetical protein